MKPFLQFIHRLFNKKPSRHKRVALVLSGGGAKGWAHIGAIDALTQQGFEITSIAGTSMGALVGGLYAAGKLEELRKISETMTHIDMIKLFGFSPGIDHITNGENIMSMFNELIGNVRIEDLSIPFCCSASDLVRGEEIIFRSGCLKQAIRASISIPIFFKPINDGTHFLVDGSVHNTLPLNRVVRHPHDLLVAINVSGADKYPNKSFLHKPSTRKDNQGTLRALLQKAKPDLSSNYINVAMRVIQLTIQNNTEMASCLTPPDLYVNIPMDGYGLFDFEKGKQLIEHGREITENAISEYNMRQSAHTCL